MFHRNNDPDLQQDFLSVLRRNQHAVRHKLQEFFPEFLNDLHLVKFSSGRFASDLPAEFRGRLVELLSEASGKVELVTKAQRLADLADGGGVIHQKQLRL